MRGYIFVDFQGKADVQSFDISGVFWSSPPHRDRCGLLMAPRRSNDNNFSEISPSAAFSSG
jgi:hypothetical protein